MKSADEDAGRWQTALAWPFILLVRAYQVLVSPLTPPSCRYYPSCSAYALTALRRFGPLRGSWLTIRRLGRCHPWCSGGVDHVPPRSADGRIDWETHRAEALERESRWGAVEDDEHHVPCVGRHEVRDTACGSGSVPDEPGGQSAHVRRGMR